MAARLEDPETWIAPPLLWVVIDDPGGLRLKAYGFWEA